MEVNYERDQLKVQILEARKNLRLALQDEQLADAEHVEFAIIRVKSARDHLNSLYKQAKLAYSM